MQSFSNINSWSSTASRANNRPKGSVHNKEFWSRALEDYWDIQMTLTQKSLRAESLFQWSSALPAYWDQPTSYKNKSRCLSHNSRKVFCQSKEVCASGIYMSTWRLWCVAKFVDCHEAMVTRFGKNIYKWRRLQEHGAEPPANRWQHKKSWCFYFIILSNFSLICE